MHFGTAGAAGAARTASGDGLNGRLVIDLAAFTPASTPRRNRWRHSIRQVDAKGRVRLDELRSLHDGHCRLSAAMSPDGWILAPDNSAAWRATVDHLGRVVVPSGVRHQLDLGDAVVVSVAPDRSRVIVWSAARLDQLMGALA